ncbi:MAG: hydrogenase maturation peptidase HycI [Spirochaetia bacterium]
MRNPPLALALTKALSRRRPDAEGAAAPGRLTVILGVGSELRGDDAAGILVAERVSSLGLPGVRSLSGGTAPENLTGEIRKLSPSHLIIVDAADMGLAPGTIQILDPGEISGISFATHALPLSVLAGYLESETGCSVIIMGIQPRSLEFDAAVTPEASQAVDEAVNALALCLGPF